MKMNILLTIAICFVTTVFVMAQQQQLPTGAYLQLAMTKGKIPDSSAINAQFPHVERLWRIIENNGNHHVVLVVNIDSVTSALQWCYNHNMTSVWRNFSLEKMVKPTLPFFTAVSGKPLMGNPLTEQLPAVYSTDAGYFSRLPVNPFTDEPRHESLRERFTESEWANLTTAQRRSVFLADSLARLSDPNFSTLRHLDPDLSLKSVEVQGKDEMRILPSNCRPAVDTSKWIPISEDIPEALQLAPYRVQMAVFGSQEPHKAPPIQGLTRAWDPYAVGPAGYRGVSYFLLGYNSVADAQSVAEQLRKMGYSAFYNKELSSRGFVLTGWIPIEDSSTN